MPAIGLPGEYAVGQSARVRIRRLPAIIALILVATLAACTRPLARWDAASTPSSRSVSPSSTSTSGATPKPDVTPTTAGGPRTLTILGAGDELPHPQVWAQASKDAKAAGRSGRYFDPIFAGVKPAITAASLAICHMETPLAPAAGPFTGFPRFSVPPEIATTLHDIGYDTCSTASNHTLDQGTAGIKRTLDALDAAGVRHTGSYRSAAEAGVPDILDVTPLGGGAPVKIAQLSYTFGFNGLRRPAGQSWVANRTDTAAILTAAHAAKRAGARIVVLSIHWGVEYSHTPNADQRGLAATLLASPDIDLILGCHEHVVQPVARVGGKWVVYGMGNQLARHAEPIDANREGIMAEFTFSEVSPGTWTVTAARVIPTWVALTPDIRVLDLPTAIDDPHTSATLRGTYRSAVRRISGYVLSLGGAAAGLTIASD